MGIMSKGNRPSERPKPPTLKEIEDDLKEAKDTDIALIVGQKHLPSLDAESGPNLNASSSSTEGIEVGQGQIKESYDKVLRLLDLYASLKEAPTELEEQISRLKVVGADMAESISHLKSLSESIGASEQHGHSAKTSDSSNKEGKHSSHKEKPKAKRKK